MDSEGELETREKRSLELGLEGMVPARNSERLESPSRSGSSEGPARREPRCSISHASARRSVSESARTVMEMVAGGLVASPSEAEKVKESAPEKPTSGE